MSNGYRRLFNDAGALGGPLAEACPAISGKDWAELFDRAHLAGERQSARRLPAGFAGDNPTFVIDVVCVPLFETGGGVGGVFCQAFNVVARGEDTSADSG
ncbi:hypothetical protein [Sandarakinorhabdus sp. DWP1-3-1]|uniref:hypothetical protein n=1 Tax=Sandarakinorhabdus sp. DWP1-3-1 TaxID=2804627 RepID=UPI003CF9ADD4